MYSHLTDPSLQFVSSIHPLMPMCFWCINSILKLLSSMFLQSSKWQIHHCKQKCTVLFGPSTNAEVLSYSVSIPSSNCSLQVSSFYTFERSITVNCSAISLHHIGWSIHWCSSVFCPINFIYKLFSLSFFIFPFWQIHCCKHKCNFTPHCIVSSTSINIYVHACFQAYSFNPLTIIFRLLKSSHLTYG